MGRKTGVPSREVLAAIAAAYRIVATHGSPPAPPPSRWRLAGRLPVNDAPEARNVARAASRWSAAGRIDD